MKAIRNCLVLLSLAFCLQPLSAQEADQPNGYMIRLPYPNANSEILPFETIAVTDVYRGSVKNAAGREVAFSSKLVVSIISLDASLHESLREQTRGAGGTFLGSKILYVTVSQPDITKDIELDDLKRQKAALDKLIDAHKAKKQLEPVSEQLAETIARYESGERKVAGNWLNAEAYAAQSKKVVDAADAPFSFTTNKGIRYTQVRVNSVNENGVSLAMQNGIGRVELEEIPKGAPGFPDVWMKEIIKLQVKAENEAAAKEAADPAAEAPATETPDAGTPAATPEQQKATPPSAAAPKATAEVVGDDKKS